MRRVILSMFVTLDGFISGLHGELDWMPGHETPDMEVDCYMLNMMDEMDTTARSEDLRAATNDRVALKRVNARTFESGTVLGELCAATREEARMNGFRYRAGSGFFALFESAGAASGSHTQMGWEVADIKATVAALRARGVVFEEYDLPGLKTVNGIAEIAERVAG